MIRDDDYNDYLSECAMNRILEEGKSPFCLSAEQYCHAFMKDGINACEDCPYCKGFREQDEDDDFEDENSFVDFKGNEIILKSVSRREINILKNTDCLNGIVEKVI